MHIILIALTTIAGIVWALWRLQQSGVDLNSFNPFYWLRRRAWAQQVGTKPRHQITNPMEAAAALLLGAVKTEGEISREQKQCLIQLFEDKFHLSPATARDLFSATAFMLQDVADMAAEVRLILSPSLEKFSADQQQSVIDMLINVCKLDGEISEVEQAVIDAVKAEFEQSTKSSNEWS